jgi:hypothetical protein
MSSYSEKCRYYSGWFSKFIPYLLFSLPVVLTCQMSFFWDTLQLASRHAHFFYENNFGSFFLPNDMDSGHIPAFGMYIALMWKLFGKSLVVSHLSMLPFVWSAVFFTRKLVNQFFNTRWNHLITCFLLADATILTQFTLVSPDVWIICFFPMALFSLRARHRILLVIATLGLTLTSMRGMMLVAAIFLAEGIHSVFFQGREQTGSRFRKLTAYLLQNTPLYFPAFGVAAAYLGIHFMKTGWIGYHDGMPWAEHFQRVNLVGFFRNLVIFIWRLSDQGRIFIWFTGFILLAWSIRKKVQTGEKEKWLLTYTLVILVALSYSALTYKNLSGFRYLIPVFYLIAITMVFYLHSLIQNRKQKAIILGLLAAGLLSGNFWVYPDRIAKGWDAMLSYLPYQHLRKEMIRNIENDKIDFSEAGTGFPNNIPLKYIDLTNDTRSFRSVENNIDQFRYIFWSNVFNDFSDAELSELKSEWKLVKTLKMGQVKVILYEHPNHL